MIDGEEAEIRFPLRTTETIRDNIMAESFAKNVSMNVVVNTVLSKWVKQREKKNNQSEKK